MDVRRRAQIGSIKKVTSGGGYTNSGSYTVNLNSQWQLSSTVSNPDSSLYEGVYESFSNYNVNSGTATMTITITGYKKFSLYIRSYAESSYDYVMVGQLDTAITGSTSYSSTDVKAHTRGNQQSGIAISNYTLVEFDNMTGGTHTITIVYRKDGSVNKDDDRGYVLISKTNESYENVDPEEPGSGGSDVININNYLTIEALENGLTASLSTNACEYCVDGDGNWKSLTANKATESINTGHTLSFRGELTLTSSKGIGTFTVNKNFNLKGNCMSMLFGDTGKDNYSLSGKNYAFHELFRYCTTLKSVSANFLPATTLANYCYNYMFYGCTSLTSAPELPARTLAINCYNSMFQGCTSLTSVPELPATALVNYCYYNMFRGCTSLITAPELPATILTDSCYYGMFQDCSSLTTAPELPATILADSCYYDMFYGCTSLTTAPALPVTTLAIRCYEEMFRECKSLTTAPELPATTLANYCYNSMFSYCKSLTTAPELPATTLASHCYSSMFQGCSKLNYIKALFTTTPSTSYTSYWVAGVASSGTFVKNPEATWDVVGSSGVPEGWTVVNDGEESGGGGGIT